MHICQLLSYLSLYTTVGINPIVYLSPLLFILVFSKHPGLLDMRSSGGDMGLTEVVALSRRLEGDREPMRTVVPPPD